MKTVALGELVEIVSGATPRTSDPDYWQGDVRWATPADLSRLDGPYIHDTPRMLTDAGLRSCAARVLPEGSVLLSSRAPIGHVAINSVPMATNQGFKSLIPGPRVDAKYLYHWLRANTAHLQSLGNGATFKELSKKTVEHILVPLPAIDEQRRIAAILDYADALRAKRGQVLAHLDSLTQSIFRDMFGDPDDAPDEVSFGDVATLLAGRNLVHDDAAAASPFRVIKISAVTSGKFRPTESKPLPSDYNPPVAHLVQPGDLLMSRANTAALVGAVAYVRETPANLALPDKVWKFAWHDDRSVPLFYHALFGSPTMRRRISQLASGTGGSMKNISKANLEKLNLPKVDYARQEAFADRARAVASAQGEATRALREQSGLIASLRSRAFRGSL